MIERSQNHGRGRRTEASSVQRRKSQERERRMRLQRDDEPLREWAIQIYTWYCVARTNE